MIDSFQSAAGVNTSSISTPEPSDFPTVPSATVSYSMPLHLLGKKSWNVYNADNIARVRRDEAEAQAREDAEKKRLRDADASYRLERLRNLPDQSSSSTRHLGSNETSPSHSSARKRRKLAGEDDTDRDIRLARADVAALTQVAGETGNISTAPIIDDRGHINLFPAEEKRLPKNEEVELEKAKKRREYEDQYTMRLSNAAGREQGSVAPWYSMSKTEPSLDHVLPGKDVWGNEDPGRRVREQARLSGADPLAAMKKGVKQLRESEKRRKEWMEQRERDLNEVEKLARREHRRKRRSSSEDSLEKFHLDPGYTSNRPDHSSLSRHGGGGSEKSDGRRRHRPRHKHHDRDRVHKYHRNGHQDDGRAIPNVYQKK